MRRAARLDANQAEIVAALRRIGASVHDTSAVGRGRGWKVCATCGGDFHNYSKKSRFCSQSCAGKSPENIAKALVAANSPRKARAPVLCTACGVNKRLTKYTKHCGQQSCKAETNKKRGPKPLDHVPDNKVCMHCGETYHAYAKTRKYCTYKCSINAGTATKAGQASARAIMKYGAKKDANHNEIFDELRKHCAVYDLSSAGCGLPDGIAWINEAWHLFDVKNPKTGYGRRGLNPVQKNWIEKWDGGPVYLIYTAIDATEFGNGKFDSIKSVGSAGSVAISADDAVAIVMSQG